MRGMRFLIAICVVALALVTSLSLPAKETDAEALLRGTDVAEAFQKAGVTVKPDVAYKNGDFELNGERPYVMSLEGSGEKLVVYEFASIGDCQNALYGIYETGAMDQMAGIQQLREAAEDQCFLSAINAKNLLILYATSYDDWNLQGAVTESAFYDEFVKLYAPNIERLQKICFEQLNGGQESYYIGSGDNWSVKIAAKYYSHPWQDQTGAAYEDNYFQQNVEVKYSGPDQGEKIDYRLVLDGEMGSVGGNFVYDAALAGMDGFQQVGSFEGYKALRGEDAYSAMFQWGYEAEVVDLTLVQ